MNPIFRLLDLLLRLFLPPSGRHRLSGGWAVVAPRPAAEIEDPAPTRECPRLRGEDSRLVRPYLTAYEAQESVRLQRRRRCALWLAVHGVVVGPRLIRGVEVA